MQEVFYEESVDTHKQAAAKRRYMLFKIVSIIAVILGVIAVIMFFFGIPIGEDGITPSVIAMLVVWGITAVIMFAFAILLGRKKHSFYLSYDYTFVSGELRISKVFNNRRRKHLYNIPTDRIIKIGRVGSDTYSKTKKTPETKEDILTPNNEAEDDKEFFYIYAQTNVGKRILVLECRQQLLFTIVRYMNKPNIFESEFNKRTVSK